MSYFRRVPNSPHQCARAAVAAVNELIEAQVRSGEIVHHKVQTAAVTALEAVPAASDLGTSRTLTRALALAVVAHGADGQAHSAAVAIDQAAAWTSAPAEPNLLTEVQATLNEIKADINTHVLNTTAHRSVWGTIGGAGTMTAKAITTADASDQTTANALANAIKAFLIAHMRAGCSSIQLTET